MSSQARKRDAVAGQVASKDDECVAGRDDERRGGAGHGREVVHGAGAGAERRDNVPPPSLQPPMAAFKVASTSQE